MLKFFRFPFGTTGTKATVPDTVQPSGTVSYQEGWGPDYERDPATDAAAKRIPRDQTNQMMFDVTSAIRELQVMGAPDFITPALNGGTAFAYARNATVIYQGNRYISLADNNTALPNVPSAWALDGAFSLDTLRANEAQARARSSNDVVMTPLRTAQSIEQFLADGATTTSFRIGNWLVQVGRQSVAANPSVPNSGGSFAFPIAFAETPYVVGQVTVQCRGDWAAMSLILNSAGPGGANYILDTTKPDIRFTGPSEFVWVAIGRWQ